MTTSVHWQTRACVCSVSMANVCPVGYVVTKCMTLFQDNNNYTNYIGSKKNKHCEKNNQNGTNVK